MKLNKKAVLSILLYWFLFFSVGAYCIGTLFLILNYHAAFCLLMLIPFITISSIQMYKDQVKE